ncbi:hypothetical protein ROT00_03975 [Agromyces mediolanus]|uniref:hypothetical protein n=1 Tax=Agromyces mediolanus TaxID=41986 RepID=UPI003835BEB7
MRAIDGGAVGRWSLRLDAAYCAVLGAGVALWAVPIAPAVGLPVVLVVAIGVAVVLWAGIVAWMLARLPLRRALRFVMLANLAAALAVAAVSLAAATVLVVLAVLAVAVDVALFAVSQAVALRTLPTAG